MTSSEVGTDTHQLPGSLFEKSFDDIDLSEMDKSRCVDALGTIISEAQSTLSLPQLTQENPLDALTRLGRGELEAKDTVCKSICTRHSKLVERLVELVS